MNSYSSRSAYFLLSFFVVTSISQPADTWNHTYREELLSGFPVLMLNSNYARLSKKAAVCDNDVPLISRMDIYQPNGDKWARTGINYYSYDDRGRIVQLDVPPGSVWKYEYSESGKKVTQTRIIEDTVGNYNFKNKIEYYLCNDTLVNARYQICDSYECFFPSKIVLPVDSIISIDSVWDTLTASWIQTTFFIQIYTYEENHIHLQGTYRKYDKAEDGEIVFEPKFRLDYSFNENNLPERVVKYSLGKDTDDEYQMFDRHYSYENDILKSVSEFSDSLCYESHYTFCYLLDGRIDTILSRCYVGPETLPFGCIMEPPEERSWMLSKYVFIYNDSSQVTTQWNGLNTVRPPFSVTMNKKNIIISSCENTFINQISLFNLQGKLLYRWVPNERRRGQRFTLPVRIDHSISLLQIYTKDGVFASTITNLSAMK